MNLLNPWVILAIALAWLGSLVGVGAWQNSAGETKERSAWQAKENVEITAANTLIQKLQTDARTSESNHAQALVNASKNYQEGLTKNEVEKSKFVTGVRNGSIVLRQPTPRTESSGAGSGGEVGATTSGCDGKAGSELQGDSAEFLYGRATLADDITLQLAACQEVVLEDRRLCGQILQ